MPITTRRRHPSLPIFELSDVGRRVAYVPGNVLDLRGVETEKLFDSVNGHELSGGAEGTLAQTLRNLGGAAVKEWRSLSEAPFRPECLTLYLSNRCDLGCRYCFAADNEGHRRTSDGGDALPQIDLEDVRSAARLVRENCVAKELPLSVVLHGGGEPTGHWQLLQALIGETRRMATEVGIGYWNYLATNGFVSVERARWLADHFSRIGLSCDGPPDIQNRQRPGPGGVPTSDTVERTAAVFRERQADFDIRVTLAPQDVDRQSEIVAYLHQQLQPVEIRLDPRFQAAGHDTDCFRPEDAERFVDEFVKAQETAEQLGARLTLAGVRLDEIHGPHCTVLKDVLHLTPDGQATACFLCTDGTSPENRSMVIGSRLEGTDEFVLEEAKIAEIRQRAMIIPDRCHGCANIHHCARDCPDRCPAKPDDAANTAVDGFRCRVQKALGERWILGSLDRTKSSRVDESFMTDRDPQTMPAL